MNNKENMSGKTRVAPERMVTITILSCLVLIVTAEIGVAMRIKSKNLPRPKCACGCGEYVNRSKVKSVWNTYVNRHSQRGATMTEEHKSKLRKVWIGRKHTEESKKKMSNSAIGRKLSEEHKEKISKSLQGHHGYWKGKKHSEEYKLKMSLSHRGEKGSGWKGGISILPYSKEWTRRLKDEIRERDDRKCCNPECQGGSNLLDVHHINYDKENCDPSNLICLCRSCHTQSTAGDREYWKNYYQKIMKERNLLLRRVCGRRRDDQL